MLHVEEWPSMLTTMLMITDVVAMMVAGFLLNIALDKLGQGAMSR